MNIRIDLAALKRGHTEHGEICEIAGVGPIPFEAATGYFLNNYWTTGLLDY